MALQWQNTGVPFGRGVDTKSDVKLVDPPFLTNLENGVFDAGGSIIKRNGYAELSRAILGGGSISAGVAFAAFQQELLVFDGTNAYSRSAASAQWVSKGRAVSLLPTNTQVIRNAAQQTMPDSAFVGGVGVYAWEDTRGGVRATVVDTTTGAAYVADTVISNSGSRPKCIAVGANYLFVVYADGNNLCLRRCAISNPTAFDAEAVIITDLDSSGLFDIMPFGGDAIFAYLTDAGTSTLTIAYLTRNGFLGAAINGYYDPLSNFTGLAGSSLAVFPSSDGSSIWIAYAGNNGAGGYSTQLVHVTSHLVNDITRYAMSTHATNITNITGIETVAGTQTIFYEVSAAQSYNTVTYKNVVTTSGTTVSGVANSVLARSVGLASKTWTYGGIIYVQVAFDSALQPTYFTLDDSGNVISRQLYGLGGGLTAHAGLPAVNQRSMGVYSCAALQRQALRSDPGVNVYSLKGVVDLQLDFTQASRYRAATLGLNLHILGGMLLDYDGNTIVEHGFHQAPENVSISTSAMGGSISDGTRLYQVVYQWVDKQGQVHRSSPSAQKQVVYNNGGSSQSGSITIPTLRLTAKTNVCAIVYRSIDNGTILYRSTTIASPTLNDPTVDSVTYVDTVSDTAIQTSEVIYTNGGELPNDAPPPVTSIIAAKNRLFLLSTEDPNAVYVSKEYIKGEAIGFSSALKKTVNAFGGSLQALGAMDDKVVCFKSAAVFYFSGDGPTSTGDNDTFTDPQLVAADTGCAIPASIVLMADGLMFKSAKGIRLLDRALQLTDVGSPVTAYDGETVTSAALIEKSNQVRFTTQASRALVYDYYWKAPGPGGMGIMGQWSTFTNHESVAAIEWNGTYCILKSDGRVFQETPGTYLDGMNPIKLRIETAWLKPAGLLGYLRARRMAVLGTYKSSHTLLVRVAYNYGDYLFYQQFNTDTGLSLTSWGSDSSWGSGTPWGGNNDGVYDPLVHLPVQKFASVRFSFEDLPNVGKAAGQSFALAGLNLELGAKKGLLKLPQVKVATSV